MKNNRSDDPVYKTWQGMKQRCLNTKHAQFKNYGARGIKICERWLNSFDNFYADMGPRPTGLTIERIDNNGNYEPGNCKWADRREQRLNQRTCHYLEKDGLRMTVRDWAKHLDLHESVLHYRLRIGLPTEKVLMPKRETQKTWSSRPTALQLREVFDYDPETGIITRKNSDLCRLNKEGDAGHVDVKGYLAITTGPYRFAGHRVAWALFYGEWPKKALKHINRDKLDNRIANLREAT